jgi:NAD+ diphosphatase
MKPPIFYVSPAHDRGSQRRVDAEWLQHRRDAHAATRFVPFWQGRSLVREGGATGLEAVLVERDRLGLIEEATLLGLDGDAALFAVELSGEEPLVALGLDAAAKAEFLDLRQASARLPGHEAALLAQAKALLHWHSRHRFCGVCGSPTRSDEAGHVRRCTNPACTTTHFPRTDPAVIMLVVNGDEALLGRQKAWPPGMYSVLAGFVEPGETLEAAVAREVHEETGIEVTDVAYRGSQPWPFPASIMLGFRARATTTEIRVDEHELEAARWVSRRWLIEHPDDPGLRLPPRGSISRRLVEEWLEEDGR